MSLLSLKGLKVPSKEVKVNIFGEEREVTIYPIAGFGLLKIQELSDQISEDEKSTDHKAALVKFTILKGCKTDEETADFLIENDIVGCTELTNEILTFSKEYNEAKLKEEEASKKKLKKS